MVKNLGLVSSSRVHGLDALRGFALLLGVVLHGLLPFAPGELWLVNDRWESFWAVAAIGPIHMFRMALFLMLAGYLGRGALRRRGPKGYFWDRFRRLLLPLFAFWPIAVLPLAFFAVQDAARRGVEVQSPEGGGFPTAHLWFLWVLFECVLLALLAHSVVALLRRAHTVEAAMQRLAHLMLLPGGVLLAAAPYVASMWLQDTTQGIVAPVGLTPEPAGLVGYGGAFLVGWVLSTAPDGLARLARQWPAHLAVAVACSVALVAHDGWPHPLIWALYGVGGWCWVYALTGIAVRHLDAERPWVRYLADASYWIYLLHLLPLLGLELLVADLPWPMVVKLAAVWLPSLALLLVTYDLLVRSTWVGTWLSGRRHPRVLLRIGSVRE
ncbi:acyltransferase family protein [Tessaracoccus sp. OH4464_COT-324]|uniref:acyltransferase family protein n=1 Tax=Tessaracoccus sp. OH4464_COT-324 TaxID=2491059 RepID=UPI000F63E0C1|nr:acyltransferase family protein [Tessaracoccus sp. OH4464_COT-324]RRD46350.1 acyltransferase [Tessaracoccus sp. OH4464_COT-324]